MTGRGAGTTAPPNSGKTPQTAGEVTAAVAPPKLTDEFIAWVQGADPGYDTYSVSRGDTVEAIARATYGDDWRAGVAAIIGANNLRANANGSPLIYAGSDIVLPSLNGLDTEALSRSGGAIIANNSQGIAASQAIAASATSGGLNLGLASFTADPATNRAFQFQTYLDSHPIAQQLWTEGNRYADAIDRLVANDLPLETPWFDPVNLAMYADLPAAGYSLLRAGARYGLERAALRAGSEVDFSSGANLSRMALPRSAELGEVSTTGEILRNGFIPGREGVTLSQRSVVFADIARMSEMHGVEFALTKENGAWRLYSGGVDSVGTPLGANTRVLAHTHPGGSPLPSPADIAALNRNFDARLAVNPAISPYPSRVIYGTGADDVTLFWPNIR
jgi:phage tail protein X